MSTGGERTSGPLPRPPQGRPGTGARRVARAALLAETAPGTKLAAITGGDPLGLYPLAAARVRERCLVLDPDRAFDESVFNVVALSLLLERRDDFDAWLLARVDEALDNLVRRDSEALRRGALDDEQVRESGEYLAGCLGLPADEALAAATRFNRLPWRTRRAFFALLVEQRTVADCLRAELGPRDDLRERTLRALEALLGPRPASIRDAEDGDGLEGEPDRAPRADLRTADTGADQGADAGTAAPHARERAP